jgi:hypothetical protein
VTEGVQEPNPLGTASADLLGVAAAVSGRWQFGAASSLISLAVDHSQTNVAQTAATTVIPLLIEGTDVPIAFGFALWDGSQFAGQMMINVFTPDALQSDKTPTGSGNVVQNPQAFFDSGQFFGPNQ